MKSKVKKGKKNKSKPKVIEIPKLFPDREITVKLIKPEAQDNSHFLNEIKEKIDQYNIEVVNHIIKNDPVEYQNFKRNFYGNLEILYQQTVIIEDKNLKSIRTKQIWDWYQDRLKFFTDIHNINSRTQSAEWERHPNLDNLDTKSDYYKAFNYPNKFEYDFRTEHEGLLPPKDRLKEFVTKHIISKDHIEDNDKKDLLKSTTKTKGDERLISANSGLRNTNYTSNTTGSKFFRSSEKSAALRDSKSASKLIKSNFSHLKPMYNLSNLSIENTFIIHKNRQLSQKRHQEEVKEYLQDWGRKKAYFNQDQQKNTEIRDLIMYYDNLNYHDDDGEFLKENNTIKVMNNLEDKSNQFDDDQIELHQEEEIKNEEKAYEPKILEKTFIDGTNSCENLIYKNKNIILESEKFPLNFRLNLNQSINKLNIVEIHKFNNEKIDSTSYNILRQLNHIFDTRINYSSAANYKEIDNPITNYAKYYQPLSNSDSNNVNKTSMQSKFKTFHISKSRFDTTNFFQKKNQYCESNFTSISKFNNYHKNFNFDSSEFKKSLIPPSTEKVFNKFFLPNPLDETISRPSDKKIKKNKLKKK